MDEKDKAMQEEKKEAMDGVMSDDELEAVGGGIGYIRNPDSNSYNDTVCGCMDGMMVPKDDISQHISIQDKQSDEESRPNDISHSVNTSTSSKVDTW